LVAVEIALEAEEEAEVAASGVVVAAVGAVAT
jgi:hypothetical protein